jgi:hypothetical protein
MRAGRLQTAANPVHCHLQEELSDSNLRSTCLSGVNYILAGVLPQIRPLPATWTAAGRRRNVR